MKLFACGCSFTWGGELFKFLWDENKLLLDENNTNPTNLNRLEITWPGQLFKLGQFSEFHNYSMGCGSNNRIIRKTLDFFIDKINKNEDLDEWIVIIQWTEPNRFEFFDEESNGWALVKSEVLLTENPRFFTEKEREQILSQYFWNHKKAWNEKMFAEITNLGNFFKFHNIKYFFVSINEIEFNTNAQKDYCKTFNWYNNDINQSFITQMKDVTTCNASCHPSEEGHRQLAEKFLNFLKVKYTGKI